MAKHNEIGELGEKIVANRLENKGYKVLDRNYRKKWGEIDIVALKDKKLYFVEVKTVSRYSVGGKFPVEVNNYRPEENLHPRKILRLKRAIQTYLLEKFRGADPEWQFDLICVFVDPSVKIAKIRYINNIVL
jgi:putative endonuclease